MNFGIGRIVPAVAAIDLHREHLDDEVAAMPLSPGTTARLIAAIREFNSGGQPGLRGHCDRGLRPNHGWTGIARRRAKTYRNRIQLGHGRKTSARRRGGVTGPLADKDKPPQESP